MFGKLIVISEFGSIEERRDGVFTDGGQQLSAKAFDNLWKFSHSDDKNFKDIDKVFKKTMHGGFRKIQASYYVGTVQTKDGTIIEILPKIYRNSGQEETDRNICRNIFLKMLSSLCSSDAATFQDAGLQVKKGFPILETYIGNYLREVEMLCQTGLGKNYVRLEENERFLKGRLMVPKHFQHNSIDNSRFFISYDKYQEQIPQNRLIVSTLLRLQHITTSPRNRADINTLLDLLSDIQASTDIQGDISKAQHADRSMEKYTRIISWSETILLGKGFTAFSGDYINQALLYPAEKLFEDYVAKLFKDFFRKFSEDFKVHTQHTGYYLVDKHTGSGRFRLRPDIFIEAPLSEYPFYIRQSIIIDTKWKNLDESRPDKNYFIDIKDMYQLFAYGKKYEKQQGIHLDMPTVPKLVLIYPCSQKFRTHLNDYIFDEIEKKYNLRLMVEPFDLTSDYCGCMRQIGDILTRAYNEVLLIGCYRNQAHLDWILTNKFYNVRLKKTEGNSRPGAVEPTGLIIKPSKLLLYNINDISEFKWFDLDLCNIEQADITQMEKLGYPFNSNSSSANRDNKYLLYKIIDRSSDLSLNITPSELVSRATGYDLLNGQMPHETTFIPGSPIYIDKYTELLD